MYCTVQVGANPHESLSCFFAKSPCVTLHSCIVHMYIPMIGTGVMARLRRTDKTRQRR